jgi:hypothetical protein
LLSAFAPAEPSQDNGLDGVFVVTDTQPLKPSPRFVRQMRVGDVIHLEWDGEGDVFQVESAAALSGPWSPCTDIIPDLACDTPFEATATRFYRLRQW